MPFQLRAQWSKTIHQAIEFPDTMSRFTIQSHTSFDTVFGLARILFWRQMYQCQVLKNLFSIFLLFQTDTNGKWSLMALGC